MDAFPLAIIVAGPAGTGKSTVAAELAKHYGCPFIEGDSLHPPENVAKMTRGIPLEDEDRWGWLARVGEAASSRDSSAPRTGYRAVVLCSALKRAHRQEIRRHCHGVGLRYVFLRLPLAELERRVTQRAGHFMKAEMVRLQWDAMQVPEAGELASRGGDCVVVDTSDKSPREICEAVVGLLPPVL